MKMVSLIKDKTTFNLPTNAIFIIDGVASAFMVAVVCQGKSIHCIFEVKKTPWREVDFVGMYKLILHDVHLLSIEIVHVESLYFVGSDLGLLERKALKTRFLKTVRKNVKIPRNVILVSTCNSTILTAYRFSREYMLIDEGASSLISRNISSSGSICDWLKESIYRLSNILGLDKELAQSNITLTADQSINIGCRVNFTGFQSSAFKRRYFNNQDAIRYKKKSVLVLLAGPHHLSPHPISWQKQPTEAFLEFNLREIFRFVTLFPEFNDGVLYLKTHPFLGVSNELLDRLPRLLQEKSIAAVSIFDESNDLLQASLPAEAFLSVGKFSALLSLDVSSTVWNVCHHDCIRCFMPYGALVRFQRIHGDARMQSLYTCQAELNRICGNHVIFF